VVKHLHLHDLVHGMFGVPQIYSQHLCLVKLGQGKVLVLGMVSHF